jgi:hypothetical protein
MIGQGKGTNAAHRMTGHFGGLIVCQHLGLKTKEFFKTLVAHLAVPGSTNQDTAAVLVQKSQCFADARAFHTYRQSSKIHCGTGHIELLNLIGFAKGRQKRPNLLNGHGDFLQISFFSLYPRSKSSASQKCFGFSRIFAFCDFCDLGKTSSFVKPKILKNSTKISVKLLHSVFDEKTLLSGIPAVYC